MRKLFIKRQIIFCLIFTFLTSCDNSSIRENNIDEKEIIAYYPGGKDLIDQYDLKGITQLIYSFLHLKGNKLAVDNEEDSLTIVHLVNLKNKYPKLKILVALGGWGGCKTCSDVFSTVDGREEFASSTAKILEDYNLDGIDLDWELSLIHI